MSSLAAAPPPAVLKWYRAYAVVLALVYVALSTGVAVMAVLAGLGPHRPNDPPAWVPLFVLAWMVPLTAAFVAAPFLPPRPWAWTYHLVLICVGFTSVCCLPLCVPMMLKWITSDTRAYFGRGDRA